MLDAVCYLKRGREIDLITCHIIQHKKNLKRKNTLVFLVERKILWQLWRNPCVGTGSNHGDEWGCGGKYITSMECMYMDHYITELHMHVAVSLLCKESKGTESSIFPWKQFISLCVGQLLLDMDLTMEYSCYTQWPSMTTIFYIYI